MLSLYPCFCQYSCVKYTLLCVCLCSRLSAMILDECKRFMECTIRIFNPAFVGFEETPVIDQFNFTSVFLCFSSATINQQTWFDSGILHQDYTQSYEVALVTINRQTLHDSSILRQDFGIVRGLTMDHTRFVDWVTIWVVHLVVLLPHLTRLCSLCIAAIAGYIPSANFCNFIMYHIYSAMKLCFIHLYNDPKYLNWSYCLRTWAWTI